MCDLRAAPGVTNLKQKQTKNELLQESSKDTLRILPDPNDEIVEEAAAKMGLRKVGWIFTDLVASATTANKVELEHILKTIESASHLRLKTSAESTPTSFQRR